MSQGLLRMQSVPLPRSLGMSGTSLLTSHFVGLWASEPDNLASFLPSLSFTPPVHTSLLWLEGGRWQKERKKPLRTERPLFLPGPVKWLWINKSCCFKQTFRVSEINLNFGLVAERKSKKKKKNLLIVLLFSGSFGREIQKVSHLFFHYFYICNMMQSLRNLCKDACWSWCFINQDSRNPRHTESHEKVNIKTAHLQKEKLWGIFWCSR